MCGQCGKIRDNLGYRENSVSERNKYEALTEQEKTGVSTSCLCPRAQGKKTGVSTSCLCTHAQGLGRQGSRVTR